MHQRQRVHNASGTVICVASAVMTLHVNKDNISPHFQLMMRYMCAVQDLPCQNIKEAECILVVCGYKIALLMQLTAS